MKERKNNGVGTKSPQVTRPHSAKAEQRKTTKKEDENFFSNMVEVLVPALLKVSEENASRTKWVVNEIITDLNGERDESRCEMRTFQNEAGYTITERVNDGIVIYRKTLRPTGAYGVEYFDVNGVLACKLWFYKHGGVKDERYDAEGKPLLVSSEYRSVEPLKKFLETGNPFAYRTE
ncbi:hypothetical protein AGMMS49546_28200 [Spirochaetia bacterium]|nr:hypothetical protein AGMMS49546_28200 [Spirochaetia bacterium]